VSKAENQKNELSQAMKAQFNRDLAERASQIESQLCRTIELELPLMEISPDIRVYVVRRERVAE
jgi:hypothetical protein